MYMLAIYLTDIIAQVVPVCLELFLYISYASWYIVIFNDIQQKYMAFYLGMLTQSYLLLCNTESIT